MGRKGPKDIAQSRTGPAVLGVDHELLPVQMTDDEIRERGQELAQRIEARNDEQRSQKAEKEGMKQRLETLEGQITDLSRRVKSGIEDRFVDVEQRLVDGMVEFVRLDTNEIVRSRTATDAERQIDLFRAGAAAPAAEATQ